MYDLQYYLLHPVEVKPDGRYGDRFWLDGKNRNHASARMHLEAQGYTRDEAEEYLSLL